MTPARWKDDINNPPQGWIVCPECDGGGWGTRMAQACPRCHAYGWIRDGSAPAPIKMYSVTESELDALAQPCSWWRRRRIVRTILRESRHA